MVEMAPRERLAGEITEEMAWAAIRELSLWYDPNASISEIRPEAMIAAYSAMRRQGSRLSRDVSPEHAGAPYVRAGEP